MMLDAGTQFTVAGVKYVIVSSDVRNGEATYTVKTKMGNLDKYLTFEEGELNAALRGKVCVECGTSFNYGLTICPKCRARNL